MSLLAHCCQSHAAACSQLAKADVPSSSQDVREVSAWPRWTTCALLAVFRAGRCVLLANAETRMRPAPRQSVRPFVHIRAKRTIWARSSGSFMHSASDKHSHAFARYALSAVMGTFSSPPPRDRCDCPLTFRRDRHPTGAQAPPAVPEPGTNPRRRMSSVSRWLSSAGAALCGRAALAFAWRPSLRTHPRYYV
jgi:hypothetical protein